MDFNDAPRQNDGFEPIPHGTYAKVRKTIRPGAFSDPSQGWMDGYPTQSERTTSVYLNCEYTIVSGEYQKRKFFDLIGLWSPKGKAWGDMGRATIRAILNSARGVHPNDNTPQAAAARRINDFGELDGLEFAVQIAVEKDDRDELRNVVKQVIEPDHALYQALMAGVAVATQPAASAAPLPSGTQSPTQNTARTVPGKPSWAQ
jgi:hypothetical protein